MKYGKACRVNMREVGLIWDEWKESYELPPRNLVDMEPVNLEL